MSRTKLRRRRYASVRVLWLVLALLLTELACQAKQARPGVDAAAAQRARVKSAVDELSREYEAEIPWPYEIEASSTSERLFTLDLQQKLLDHGKAIIFVGELADIARESDRFTAVFEPALASSLRVYFRVSITESQAKRLLEQPRSIAFNEFAVVAKINRVKKPGFSVTGGGNDEPDSVNVEPAPADLFVADGTVVEFKYVGEH